MYIQQLEPKPPRLQSRRDNVPLMDDKIQQRLDTIMGPAKKARPPQKTAEASGISQGLLVFSALLAFRIVNALTIKTFFQPDEYFQALEPAWKIAFGGGSGAWITWVGGRHHSI